MPRKRTPRPLAPRHLLEELLLRQDALIKQHSQSSLRVKFNYNQPTSKTTHAGC
jgi:hypothetical protein